MSKYQSVLWVSVACAMAMLVASSQLSAQPVNPTTKIVSANTTMVARIAFEAIYRSPHRTSESKEVTGETGLEKRLRRTEELLGGRPVWKQLIGQVLRHK